MVSGYIADGADRLSPGSIDFYRKDLAALRRRGAGAQHHLDIGGGQNGEMDVFLQTDRLELRQFSIDDLDLLVELGGDAAVMRFVNGGRPVDRVEVTEALTSWMGYYERFEGFGFWAAIEKVTGAFVGWFHFRPGDGDGPLEPELGYRLHRRAWGRGLATEGSRSLIHKGFTELGIERVRAETMAVNVASRRVMEKAGLRYIRTFDSEWPIRIPGDEHGDVEYAITRAEWEADGGAG